MNEIKLMKINREIENVQCHNPSNTIIVKLGQTNFAIPLWECLLIKVNHFQFCFITLINSTFYLFNCHFQIGNPSFFIQW